MQKRESIEEIKERRRNHDCQWLLTSAFSSGNLLFAVNNSYSDLLHCLKHSPSILPESRGFTQFCFEEKGLSFSKI